METLGTRVADHDQSAPETDSDLRSYCNSILQPLFFCEPFRNAVLDYSSPPSAVASLRPRVKIRFTPRGPVQPINQKLSSAEVMRRRRAANGQPGPGGVPLRPEDRPDAPEYKKKQAMLKGPILELAYEGTAKPGSGDTTLAALQDIFRTLIEAESRTGVLSPQRFLDVFKSNNESFRNSQHQDAHEFLGLVLNSLISTIDTHSKQLRDAAEHELEQLELKLEASAPASASANANTNANANLNPDPPSSGWVHDIFEGVLTSETRCLTCETASKRDETFLDLSIDLGEHTSVTSCLESFSAEEMLCERNKFHCDRCGSLQEAEKRMKLKRLPRVLALHLKRFKITEDYTTLNKLFHRVVYPSQLRLFNTTEDAADPDRVYELYAVVIHIGPQAAQGHYVVVIKTREWGWLLFDDEMVEPVDKEFVNNFFGGRPGQPCAYVLFYQEIDIDAFAATQESTERDGQADAPAPVPAPASASASAAPIANGTASKESFGSRLNGHRKKLSADQNGAAAPGGAATEAGATAEQPATLSVPPTPLSTTFGMVTRKVRKERKTDAAVAAGAAAEKLARKAADNEKRDSKLKAKAAEHREHGNGATTDSPDAPLCPENGASAEEEGVASAPVSASADLSSAGPGGLLSRSQRGSKLMGRRGFGFLSHKNERAVAEAPVTNQTPVEEGLQPTDLPPDPRIENPEGERERLLDRIGIRLGKKKSTHVLSSA